MPRRLEEVVIALPPLVYDRVVAALASEGIFHVDDPPQGIPGTIERSYRSAQAQASEKVSKVEQFFSLAGRPPYTAGGVKIEIKSWIESFNDYLRKYGELESYYEDLLNRASELEASLKELLEASAHIEPLSHIEADLKLAYRAEAIDFLVGYASGGAEIEGLLEEISEKYEAVAVADRTAYGIVFAVAASKGSSKKISSLLTQAGAVIYVPKEDLPGPPSKAYSVVAERRREIAAQLDEVVRSAIRRLDELAEYYAIVKAFASIFRILSSTVRSGSLLIIRGFVDVRESKRLREILGRESGGAYTLISLGVRRGEERIPSKVDLPRLLRPFHRVVEIYGHPGPEEIVPTVFMAVTLPLTFALMFPDAGHGLLVVLFALLYISRFSKDWAYVIGVMGAASIVTGIMAGEFFGPIASKLVGLPKFWEELGVEVPPYALPPYAVDHGLEELTTALTMRAINVSIFMGAFMLTFGTFLGVVNAILKGDREGLVDRALPRFLMFASVSAPFLVFMDAQRGGSVISKAVRELGGGDPFATAVLAGFIIGALWMLVASPIRELRHGHSPLAGLSHSLLEIYENILMIMGNLPSFLRIMALALAHSSLTLTVAEISRILFEGGLLGDVIGAAIYVAGNVAIAGLEGLLSFAHSTRLHYYEWFSKFYVGGGIPYTPIRVEGVVVRVVAG